MADRVDHTHGDTGEKPADSLNFQTGDKPDPEVFDWFWSEVPATINNHADTLESIDSDGDGKVDAAENADTATNATNVTSTYKGNDIDSDGDGKVDAADNADTATDAENVTSTYKNNDIDSDGDGTVDEADETKSFESRTNYPTNPDAGRVVFRTDKT